MKGRLQVLSLIWGILAIVGMFLLPELRWWSYFVFLFSFSAVGLIISIIATVIAKNKRGMAIAGIVLCVIAIPLGYLIVVAISMW